MSKISSTFLLHFIHKLFPDAISTSTLPLASVSTIDFLKNSCGLASGSPSSAGRKLQLDEKNIQKYEVVIGFLKSHGFENPQIANLVSRYPWILQSKVSTNLKPKFEFLQETGFVGPLLPKLILSNPPLLLRSLDSHLKPSFFVLKEILESDEQVTAAICRYTRLLTFDCKGVLKSNVDVLVSEGVPSRNIAKMIALQPLSVMQKVDRMIHAVKTVKELGVDPKFGLFIHAVRIIVSMNDSTWKKKIILLKSLLGWSEKEIFTAFKRYPNFLGCSEEKMRDITNFLLNTVKLDPGVLISYPRFFTCALDRLRLRYKVLDLLKVKNLLKTKKIAPMFVQGESRFVEKYVVKHLDEIPNLMDIYRGNVEAKTKSVL